jgi:hypothetical protein
MKTEQEILKQLNYLKKYMEINKAFFNEERTKIYNTKILVLEWVLK